MSTTDADGHYLVVNDNLPMNGLNNLHGYLVMPQGPDNEAHTFAKLEHAVECQVRTADENNEGATTPEECDYLGVYRLVQVHPEELRHWQNEFIDQLQAEHAEKDGSH